MPKENNSACYMSVRKQQRTYILKYYLEIDKAKKNARRKLTAKCLMREYVALYGDKDNELTRPLHEVHIIFWVLLPLSMRGSVVFPYANKQVSRQQLVILQNPLNPDTFYIITRFHRLNSVPQVPPSTSIQPNFSYQLQVQVITYTSD